MLFLTGRVVQAIVIASLIIGILGAVLRFLRWVIGSILAFLVWGDLSAQVARPYITSAVFYVSADHWCDFWLNGRRIDWNVHDYTLMPSTQKSLCDFHNDNTLAIKVWDSSKPGKKKDPRIGVAYLLRITLSNGTQVTLSSNEVDEHRCYYRPVAGMKMDDPLHWNREDFDDVLWQKARSTGSLLPGVRSVADPDTGTKVPFLSASGISSQVQYPGERHYFRRKFQLDIESNPVCLGTPMPTPRPIATSTLIPTVTPSSVPMKGEDRNDPPQFTFTNTPVFTTGSMETVTPTLIRSISPSPSGSPERTLVPLPSPTKAVRNKKVVLAFIPKPQMTKLLLPSPTRTFTPVPVLEGSATSSEGEVTPTKAQTIVFDDSTANIYVQFADGPGTYRMEVVDMKGHHLRDLFEKKVVAQTDTWVNWDGKDDAGRGVPMGLDVIRFLKDEKELRELIVLRKNVPP